MTDFLLSISAGTVDWSRAQFALTAIYHWLFVPLVRFSTFCMLALYVCFIYVLF